MQFSVFIEILQFVSIPSSFNITALPTVDDSAVIAKVPGYKGHTAAADVGDNSKALLADGEVKYMGQPLVVALATTPAGAVLAAELIKVTYTGVKTDLLFTVADARRVGSYHPDTGHHLATGDMSKAQSESDFNEKDTWAMKQQYHFHMETQSAYAIPSNEGPMVVHSATQMPVTAAAGAKAALGGSVDVVVKNRRCGGAYGGKLANSVSVASLAAVCAHAVKVPVSLIYEQGTNMRSLGWRPDWECDMQYGFTKEGVIKYVIMDAYVNSGIGPNRVASLNKFFVAFDNCYNVDAWKVDGTLCKTDIPDTTSMRGPGWVPAVYFMERIVTNIALSLGVEPHVVRQINFYKKNDITPYQLPLRNWDCDQLWAQTKADSNFAARSQAVQAHNAANKWTKKGISLVASKLTVGYGGLHAADNVWKMDISMKIAKDGTVNVMSGGTEMGQGLTTKLVQVIAYFFSISLNQIKILEQDTSVIGIEGAKDATGGSVGSELATWAAKYACSQIEERLKPVRKLIPTGSWAEVIAKAYEMGISLSILCEDVGISGPVNDKTPIVYCTYGVVAIEATLDVLTGQVDFDRADITYDLGRSVNPIVDIGQVEGAFVMGMGLNMTESAEYAKDGSMNWDEYVIPTPWEIPTELNVTLPEEPVNQITAGGGKAIGEPPVTLTYACVEAVELALHAAAKDSGLEASKYRSTTTPLSITQRNKMAQVEIKNMTLK